MRLSFLTILVFLFVLPSCMHQPSSDGYYYDGSKELTSSAEKFSELADVAQRMNAVQDSIKDRVSADAAVPELAKLSDQAVFALRPKLLQAHPSSPRKSAKRILNAIGDYEVASSKIKKGTEQLKKQNYYDSSSLKAEEEGDRNEREFNRAMCRLLYEIDSGTALANHRKSNMTDLFKTRELLASNEMSMRAFIAAAQQGEKVLSSINDKASADAAVAAVQAAQDRMESSLYTEYFQKNIPSMTKVLRANKSAWEKFSSSNETYHRHQERIAAHDYYGSRTLCKAMVNFGGIDMAHFYHDARGTRETTKLKPGQFDKSMESFISRMAAVNFAVPTEEYKRAGGK